MAVLHLKSVPDQLFQRIAELAALHQLPVEEETVQLLEEVVAGRPSNGVTGSTARSQQEVLNSILQNRFTPLPGSPSVVEMLREDRER
jgi:Tfp pilus assembly protein PilO